LWKTQKETWFTIRNKQHKSGQKQNVTQQLLPCSILFAVPSLLPQPHITNANSVLPASVVPVPSGFTNQGQTVQYVAIPAEHRPPFTYSEFVRGGGFQRGFGDGLQRGRGDTAGEKTKQSQWIT